MMSDTNCCEEMLSDKSCEEMMSDKNCCKESSEEKSSEESSEENSSGDDSSEESSQSSMLVTEDSGEESDEPEYYFQQREIQQFIKHLQRPLYMKAHKDALQHACQVYLAAGTVTPALIQNMFKDQNGQVKKCPILKVVLYNNNAGSSDFTNNTLLNSVNMSGCAIKQTNKSGKMVMSWTAQS
ncbi:unnamed protein product [Mytilus edulis]|uniref:Uncharacterized protein n=1 Tax=Mytilus edulis TaxID=6550 RepID=A0A8S3RXP5_MYTED|nr:unnamed protein product [Mytilus edulis]